jgi:transposase
MVSEPIILLNHGERKRIRKLAQKTRNKIVFRRCQIIMHLAQRDHPHGIAVALACNVRTVYRTRNAFLRAGETAVLPKKSPGRPRKLTARTARRRSFCL